ncbi:MAG: c-type cytochrome [Gaiellaceae bacterium]
MRRLLPFLALAFLLAGCGGAKTASPTAATVVGSVPTTTAAPAAKGDATAGSVLFTSQGCGGCHTFKPAGTNGTVGPDLDKLADYAKTADQGSLDEFAHESIANPSAYVEKGYPPSMPDFGQTLSDKQLADLTAYLVENQKG